MSIILYTPEVQAAHRRRWADRLAKMDLPQIGGTLRNDCGYCVLGVGCEVFREVTGLGRWVPREGNWGKIIDSEHFFYFIVDDPYAVKGKEHITSTTGTLPAQVVEFYGLDDGTGSFRPPLNPFARRRSLSDLNDMSKLPFDMLADIIRNEPRGLVVGKE